MNAAQPHRQGVWPSGLALLGTCVLMLALSPVASGLPSRAAFRAQRLCSNPRPGTAACLGMRLCPPKRSRKGTCGRTCSRQAREAAQGATPKVTSKFVPGGLTPQALHAAYSLADRNGRLGDPDDRDRRRLQRPDRRSRPGGVRQTFGLPACTRPTAAFASSTSRANRARCRHERRMGQRDLARRADGPRDLSDLQLAAGGGQSTLRRPRRSRERRRGRGCHRVSNSYGGAEGPGYGGLTRLRPPRRGRRRSPRVTAAIQPGLRGAAAAPTSRPPHRTSWPSAERL